MNRFLWRLALISNFGRGSRRPLQAVVTRLSLAAAAGLALGLSVARTLREAPLPHGLPTTWVAALVLTAALALTGLTLLSLTASGPGRNSLTSNLAMTLPVDRGAIWSLRVAPLIIILALTLMLTVTITAAFAHATMVPTPPLLAALISGSLAGVGFNLLPRPRMVIARCLLLGAIVLLSGRMLSTYPTLDVNLKPWALAMIEILTILPLAGFVISALLATRRPQPTSSGRPGVTMSRSLLGPAWFILKLLRNPRGRVSLLFGLTVATTTAIAVATRHLAGPGGAGWLLIGALLASALACDVRGLAPRRRAPEIEALHGPVRFVATETLATFVLSLVLGFPMLLALLSANILAPAALISSYLALQIAATLIGLLASTIFVPGSGDLGSQFFAAAAGSSILLLAPKALHFAGSNLQVQDLAWFTIAAACYATILIIENQRRLIHEPV